MGRTWLDVLAMALAYLLAAASLLAADSRGTLGNPAVQPLADRLLDTGSDRTILPAKEASSNGLGLSANPDTAIAEDPPGLVHLARLGFLEHNPADRSREIDRMIDVGSVDGYSARHTQRAMQSHLEVSKSLFLEAPSLGH